VLTRLIALTLIACPLLVAGPARADIPPVPDRRSDECSASAKSKPGSKLCSECFSGDTDCIQPLQQTGYEHECATPDPATSRTLEVWCKDTGSCSSSGGPATPLAMLLTLGALALSRRRPGHRRDL